MIQTEWLDEEEAQTYRAFARAAKALFARFDRDLQRDTGTPRAYFEILWLLGRAPGHSLRMSDLAEATGSQASRISHAVTRLEQMGLVRRELCADDRRGWFTVLTDGGAERLGELAPRYAASIQEHFFTPLTAEEQQQLRAIGDKLLAHLGVPPAASEPVGSTAG